MHVNPGHVYQLFKYTVYALLTLNVYLFFDEESKAAMLQFADGLAPSQFIEAFASTIDTAAWVVLLLLFELETRLLDDRLFTPALTWSLRLFRMLCYSVIVYAFYGYVANVMFSYSTLPLAGVSDLCSLVQAQWSWAVTLDVYAPITAANCATLSSADEFLRFQGLSATVDASTLRDIRGLAWVDAVNGAVWLLVVALLEVDVWLQERNRFEGLALRLSTACKFLLYGLLALAVLFWMWKGQFKDWWDALLWLIAFVFIEMNVFEWRAESHHDKDAENLTIGEA
ncbi:MAG: hypothetical protein AAFX56_15925 [Pseudomonadota bacterium]